MSHSNRYDSDSDEVHLLSGREEFSEYSDRYREADDYDE